MRRLLCAGAVAVFKELVEGTLGTPQRPRDSLPQGRAGRRACWGRGPGKRPEFEGGDVQDNRGTAQWVRQVLATGHTMRGRSPSVEWAGQGSGGHCTGYGKGQCKWAPRACRGSSQVPAGNGRLPQEAVQVIAFPSPGSSDHGRGVEGVWKVPQAGLHRGEGCT